MKTAISIDDELLKDADRVAGKMGLSRSRLLAVALEAFLLQRRNNEVTDRLNEAYAETDATEARTVNRMKSKFRSTVRERW